MRCICDEVVVIGGRAVEKKAGIIEMVCVVRVCI